MKRQPACGSAKGLANLSLTQPHAIQCGHSTALLPQDVFLGHAALGLPSKALHDPVWMPGRGVARREGRGATPPLRGSLLIQEPAACAMSNGAPRRVRNEAATGENQRKAGEGRVQLGVKSQIGRAHV